MIELFWIVLTLLAAASAKVNDGLESHPVDWILTRPVIPLIGVVGSYFILNAVANLSLGLLIRFALAGLVGLALVLLATIQFSPHFGPGALGVFALYLLWWGLGAAIIAGETIYFLFRFFRR